MNNAKLWLVVKPTVGIPLFLSAVAIGSFAVHVAVLSKTNWYNNYLVGAPLASAALAVPDTGVANASYVPDGTQQVLVTLPDGTQAKAILVMPEGSTLN
jgi:light-harvesting protein B-800-850 alpha chain